MQIKGSLCKYPGFAMRKNMLEQTRSNITASPQHPAFHLPYKESMSRSIPASPLLKWAYKTRRAFIQLRSMFEWYVQPFCGHKVSANVNFGRCLARTYDIIEHFSLPLLLWWDRKIAVLHAKLWDLCTREKDLGTTKKKLTSQMKWTFGACLHLCIALMQLIKINGLLRHKQFPPFWMLQNVCCNAL